LWIKKMLKLEEGLHQLRILPMHYQNFSNRKISEISMAFIRGRTIMM
jgi:hypothetical protein